jgi:hypothetical protein
MVVLPVGWRCRIRNYRAAEQSSEAQRIVGQVEELAASLQQLLVDPQTQSLALLALAEPAKLTDLTGHLSARIPQIKQARVVPMPLWKFGPAEVAGNGFALQEMMMMVQGGQQPPLQMHPSLQPPMLVDVTGLKKGEDLVGFLVIEVEPGYVLAQFNPDLSGDAYSSISQNNGRQAAATLKSMGNATSAGTFNEKLPVSGTLFRIEFPLPRAPGFLSGSVLVAALVLGLLLMVTAVILYRLNKQWVLERPRPMTADSRNEPLIEAAPAPVGTPAPESKRVAGKTSLDEPPPAERRSAATSRAAELPDPPPMRLRYDIQERHKTKAGDMHQVELT